MRRFFFFFFTIFSFILLVDGCQKNSARPGTIDFRPLTSQYKTDLAKFKYQVDIFSDAAQNQSLDHDDFIALKEAFSKIGFLMEYLDRDRYQLFNGAPVAAEDPQSTSFGMTMPSGLQVIESELCNSEVNFDRIQDQLAQLIYQLGLYHSYVDANNFGPDTYLHALQLHLIRMEALCLTGFDVICPSDTKSRLLAQWYGIHPYWSIIDKYYTINTASIAHDCVKILETSIEGEPIDAILIIKDYLQPLRKEMNKAVAASPPWGPHTINLFAVSLYEKDFLNVNYFNSYGLNPPHLVEKVALGKQLFNDAQLSSSKAQSCASCHHPNDFFVDGISKPEVPVGRTATSPLRNTPTLINAAYQSTFMYDGRANSLEEQMIHVFNNDAEFDAHTTAIIKVIQKDASYMAMFGNAFPEMQENPVNLHSLTNSIASYIRTLTSSNSKFDRFMRGENLELDSLAYRGFNLFVGKAKCGTCHFPPLFSGLQPPFYTDSEFENIGVPSAVEQPWQIDRDNGRYIVYNNAQRKHFFKTPTLRNIDKTAPYFHNGSFPELSDVMDFYNNGGGVGGGLELEYQTLPPDSLFLNEGEVVSILHFLESLTELDTLAY